MENDAPDRQNDVPDRRDKHYASQRAIKDYGMGLFFLAFGVFLLAAPKLGYQFQVDDNIRYMFAGILLPYGAWRIYRGFKKNYFR